MLIDQVCMTGDYEYTGHQSIRKKLILLLRKIICPGFRSWSWAIRWRRVPQGAETWWGIGW